MKQSLKNFWKVLGILFPYIFIVLAACISYFEIKDYYFVFRHTTDYFAFICYVIVACTALVLAWMTWLYRRLKKKMDLLLEEKEERLFVLRHQTKGENEQKEIAANHHFDDE